MAQPYTLSEFINHMQLLVQRAASVEEIIAVGSGYVRQAIANPDLLEARFRGATGVGARHNHGTYNLYRGNGLFVSSSVWGPGDHADPHNHRTWGLIGVMENAIQETRYRFVGTDDRGVPTVERVGARLVGKGEVVALTPETDEIHELDNYSQSATVELHVYGDNLVGLDRFYFDRASGVGRPFRSGPYDNC